MFYNDSKLINERDYKVVKDSYENALASSAQELNEIITKMKEQQTKIIESNLEAEYGDLLETLDKNIKNLEGLISIKNRESTKQNSEKSLSNHILNKSSIFSHNMNNPKSNATQSEDLYGDSNSNNITNNDTNPESPNSEDTTNPNTNSPAEPIGDTVELPHTPSNTDDPSSPSITPNPKDTSNEPTANNEVNNATPPEANNTTYRKQNRGFPIQMGNFARNLSKLLNPRLSRSGASTPQNIKESSPTDLTHQKQTNMAKNSQNTDTYRKSTNTIKSSLAGGNRYPLYHTAHSNNTSPIDTKKEPIIDSKLSTNSHTSSSQNLYESIEPWGYPPLLDMPTMSDSNYSPLLSNPPYPDNIPDKYPCQPLEPSTPPCKSPCSDFTHCKPPRPPKNPCPPKDVILYHECDIISLLLLYMSLRPNNPYTHRICTIAENHFNILRNLITKEDK